MSQSSDDPTFETIDWEAYDASGLVVDWRTVGVVLSLGGLLAAFVYDYLFVPGPHVLVGTFNPGPVEWLSLVSAILLVFYVFVPLARSPRLTRYYWRKLRRKPLALVSLAYLVGFVIVGTVGRRVIGTPRTAPLWIEEPRGAPPGLAPFWSSIPVDTNYFQRKVIYCGTQVVGGRCQGTLAHPFGTTPGGLDVLGLVVSGMQVALEVTVISASLLVPIATIVGTVAAYYGGRIDTVLSSYLDLQLAIPAFIVYLLVQYLYGPSLIALIVLFGLLDWDRIARRVRSDALRVVDEGYITAAEGHGARPLDIVRRHVAPNVVSTIASGLALQIPFILLMEATLSYIGVVNSETLSWGYAIGVGFETEIRGGPGWWAYAFPLGFLLLTIVAMNILGNALYDIIEPRERGGDV